MIWNIADWSPAALGSLIHLIHSFLILLVLFSGT